jgi:hypothetical protein
LNSRALSGTGLANLLHTRLGYHDKQNAVALSTFIVFKIFRFLEGKGGEGAEGEEFKECTSNLYGKTQGLNPCFAHAREKAPKN